MPLSKLNDLKAVLKARNFYKLFRELKEIELVRTKQIKKTKKQAAYYRRRDKFHSRVLERWSSEIQRLSADNDHDAVIGLFKNFMIRFLKAQTPQNIHGRFFHYNVEDASEGVLLALGKAYLKKRRRDLSKSKLFLEFLLDVNNRFKVETIKSAIELYAHLLHARKEDRHLAGWLKAMRKRFRRAQLFSMVDHVDMLISRLRGSKKGLFPRLVVKGDISYKGMVVLDGKTIGEPFSKSKRAFQIFAVVARMKKKTPGFTNASNAQITEILKSISTRRHKSSSTKEILPGVMKTVVNTADVAPTRKVVRDFIIKTPELARIWEWSKTTGRHDIDIPRELIDVSNLKYV